MMNNKVYDVLKWIIITVVPATITLLTGLGQCFGWDWTTPVTTVMALVATFVGTLIGVSSVKYNNNNSGGHSDVENPR